MKRKNNKGFTLIEILSVIVILALVSTIGLVSVNVLVESGQKSYYKTQEENLRLATIEFIKANKTLSPLKGASQVVDVATLVNTEFVEEIVDTEGKGCYDGRVIIDVNDKNSYEYKVCLKCGNYQSPESECKINYVRGSLNVTLSTKSYDKNNNVVQLVNYDGNYTWATNDVTMDISITEPQIQKYTIEKNGKFYKECVVKPENKNTNLCKVTIPQSDLNNGTNKFKVTAIDIYNDNSITQDNIIVKADKAQPKFNVKVDTKLGDKGIIPDNFDENNSKVQANVDVFIGKDEFEGSGIKSVKVWIENDVDKTPVTTIDGKKLDPTKDNEIPISFPLLPGSDYKVIVEVTDNAGNSKRTTDEGYDVLLPVKLNYQSYGKKEDSDLIYILPNKSIDFIKEKYKDSGMNFDLPTKDRLGYDITWSYSTNGSLTNVNLSQMNINKPTNIYVTYNPTCEYQYESANSTKEAIAFSIKMNNINPNFDLTSKNDLGIVTKAGENPINTGSYLKSGASKDSSTLSCSMKGSVVSEKSYAVELGTVNQTFAPYLKIGCIQNCQPYYGQTVTYVKDDPSRKNEMRQVGVYFAYPKACRYTATDGERYYYICQAWGSQSTTYWEQTTTQKVSSMAEADSICSKSFCNTTFPNGGNKCALNQKKVCRVIESSNLNYSER